MGRHARTEEGLSGLIYNHSELIVAVLTAIALVGFTAVGVREWYVAHPRIKTITVVEKPAKRADEDQVIRELVHLLRSDRPDLDDVHVASIAGNVWGESNGDWRSLEAGRSNSSPDVEDNASVKKWAESNGTGIGILQWTGSRMDELIGLADSSHSKWSDPSTQTRFLVKELDDRSKWTGVPDDWRKAADVKTATDVMLDRFVRPGDPDQSRTKRLNGALDVYKALQNGSIS